MSFSTLAEIRAEKARLRRKAKKQEKKLLRDWERIEYSWRIFGRIASIGRRMFSSASVIWGIEMGYKIVSMFFSKKE